MVYEKMYMALFNGITDAVRSMQQQNFGFAMYTLTESQKRAEEIYIGAEGTDEGEKFA